MTATHIAAFACYAIISLFAAGFGVVYLLRPKIMPYHEEALGKSWADLDAPLQALLLGMLRVAGGGMLCGGVAIAILLLVPFRTGEGWSAVALSVIGFITLLPSVYATIFIRSRTGAHTPVWVGVAGMAILLAGSLLSAL